MLKTLEQFQGQTGDFYFSPTAFFSLLSDIQNEVDTEYVLRAPSGKPTKATLEEVLAKISDALYRLYNNYTLIKTWDENTNQPKESVIWRSDILETLRSEFEELGVELPAFPLNPEPEQDDSSITEEPNQPEVETQDEYTESPESGLDLEE